MAFTHYRTKGIFLKKEDRGEADQLFTIFTQDFGKLEILGRGIRKIKSKLRAGAELFYLSEIEFIRGKTYKTLTDASLIDKFKNLRQDCQKLDLSYRIAEPLNSLLGKAERDENIWELLLETFQRLNNLKLEIKNSLEIRNLKLEIIYYYFLWNLFSILGYAPELYSCPVCQKKLLPETFFFVPKEGGVVCWSCFKKINGEEKKETKEISVGTVKIVRILIENPQALLERLRIEEADKGNLKEISELYLSFLKSLV